MTFSTPRPSLLPSCASLPDRAGHKRFIFCLRGRPPNVSSNINFSILLHGSSIHGMDGGTILLRSIDPPLDRVKFGKPEENKINRFERLLRNSDPTLLSPGHCGFHPDLRNDGLYRKLTHAGPHTFSVPGYGIRDCERPGIYCSLLRPWWRPAILVLFPNRHRTPWPPRRK